MTHASRRALLLVLGVPALLGHGIAALLAAKAFLGLPMEAGGLFLGPVLGFPALAAGCLALTAAVTLGLGTGRSLVLRMLVAAAAFDVLALAVGIWHPLVVLGLLASAGAGVLALVPGLADG